MTAKASTPALATAQQRIARLRQAIEQADAEGVPRTSMVLRLTLRDQSELKRDPSVALDEISFAGGEMRFLGIKVVGGGVEASALDRGQA